MRQWVKLRKRNEALDLEVHALAALYIGGPVLLQDLAARAAAFARPVAEVGPDSDAEADPMAEVDALSRARESWIKNWLGRAPRPPKVRVRVGDEAQMGGEVTE